MKTFLPTKDPLKNYITSSGSLERLNDIAQQLPKLLLTGSLRDNINSLKNNDLSIKTLIKKGNSRELKLAMMQLSFISHAYIWGAEMPSKVLPEVISKPWVQLSNILGRPPILSYASYCLDNWYRLNVKKDISLENIGLLTNFLGGVDEDWFVTIHVCIEDAARDAIKAADLISRFNDKNTTKDFLDNLKLIISSLRKVNTIFSRMPEKCDPYIYYHRVRPFIFGTKDNRY